MTVTASDGTLSASQGFSWFVANGLATLATPADQANTEGDAVSLQLQGASTNNSAVLTYTVSGLPAGHGLRIKIQPNYSRLVDSVKGQAYHSRGFALCIPHGGWVMVPGPFGLRRHFRTLQDPRRVNSCQHLLLDIIAIAICAVIANADDWQGVETSATTAGTGSRPSWSCPMASPPTTPSSASSTPSTRRPSRSAC